MALLTASLTSFSCMCLLSASSACNWPSCSWWRCSASASLALASRCSLLSSVCSLRFSVCEAAACSEACRHHQQQCSQGNRELKTAEQRNRTRHGCRNTIVQNKMRKMLDWKPAYYLLNLGLKCPVSFPISQASALLQYSNSRQSASQTRQHKITK